MAHRPLLRRIAAAATTAAAAAALVTGLALPAQAASTVAVRVIAFNDLHGNLQPPAGSAGRVVLADGTAVTAGGAAYLATHVRQARGEVRNSIVLSSGDSIGASPLASALFHDEPTIAAMNAMGVQASALGNHELDEGYAELERMRFGGCHPTDGCQFRPSYAGTTFPFLASNLFVDGRDGQVPATNPFTVIRSGGVNVGIIGTPLRELPTLVTAAGNENQRYTDEVESINRSADFLDSIGVKAIVVSLHQGDSATGGPNDCRTTPGAATTIATTVSPKVDVVLSAHSHQAYSCTVTDPAGNPRPFLQGASFGRLLSVVDLRVDTATRDVVRSATVAGNRVVTRDVAPDPAVQAIVDEAVTKAAPIANRALGTITADIVSAQVASGESPLGDVIADSQLAATRPAGAQVALMNPGGVRASLTFAGSPAGEGDGVVTYGEAFTVQPFGNILQTLTYTGTQLDAVLEQQFQPQPDGSVRSVVLAPSASLTYTTSASAPVGSRVSGVAVDGVPVDPAATYRVTVNNFLAGGGDGFSTLRAGTGLTGGPIDLDAFAGYLGANPGLAPPATDRITPTP